MTEVSQWRSRFIPNTYGYDANEVDDLLFRIHRTLAQGESPVGLIAAAQFSPSGSAYQTREVDQLLDELVVVSGGSVPARVNQGRPWPRQADKATVAERRRRRLTTKRNCG